MSKISPYMIHMILHYYTCPTNFDLFPDSAAKDEGHEWLLRNGLITKDGDRYIKTKKLSCYAEEIIRQIGDIPLPEWAIPMRPF